MYQLTNVPTEASGLEIRAIVDGENINIVCSKRHAKPNDYLRMTSEFVGDHMFKKPEDLRRMYGDALATAIRMARDAGYYQAKEEIRACLGINTR